jgi:hypothetical protein
MAYNRNKVILYGVAGIILALVVLSFIPTRTETHITTSVSLTTIPDYGIQIIKMSEDNTQITNLVLNIQSIEAQTQDGAWVKISSTEQQWDIRQKTEKTITIDPNITGYSKLRINLATDNPVTLSDGQITQLGAPSLPIEVDLSGSSVNAGTQLRLSLGQGTASNYILPNLQIELSTNKLTAEIITQ